MREIKFRAWDKEKNEYFKPTYEAYRGKVEHLLITMTGRLTMRTLTEIIDESMFPDRFIVEQYTGLKDKNSVEIYEGDVITNGRNYAVIRFEHGAFEAYIPEMGIGLQIYEFDITHTLEVIGNIHEKSELLEVPNETL